METLARIFDLQTELKGMDHKDPDVTALDLDVENFAYELGMGGIPVDQRLLDEITRFERELRAIKPSKLD